MPELWLLFIVALVALFIIFMRAFVDWRIRRNVPQMLRDAHHIDKLAREAHTLRAVHEEKSE